MLGIEGCKKEWGTRRRHLSPFIPSTCYAGYSTTQLLTWENSQHFLMPTLVSQQNDIWRMSTHKYSILMTCHYPDLRGASDGWKQIVLIVWTIRSTVPYPDLVMTHHQYGIYALVPHQGSTQDSSLRRVHHLGMAWQRIRIWRRRLLSRQYHIVNFWQYISIQQTIVPNWHFYSL